MKKKGGDKGAPLLSHVSGEVLTWVTLFVNGRGALPTQHREKLKGDNLNLHFPRETFEGLEKTREYLSHNIMVTIFWCNRDAPQSMMARGK